MMLQYEIANDAAKILDDHIDRMVLLAGAGLVFDYYLEYGTGKVYGHDYLSVAPMNAEGRWNDMLEWMVTTFGTTPVTGVWAPDQRWYVNNAKFWFRNPKDRDWFVLRWS